MFFTTRTDAIPYLPNIIETCFLNRGGAFTIVETVYDSNLKHAKRNCNTLARQIPGVFWSIEKKSTGYLVSIHIPKQTSAQYYAEYFTNEGLPFKDHLLKNRRDKLLEICRFIYSTQCSYFLVSNNGIFDDLEYTYFRCYFKDFGMGNLEKCAQCYGFALAISEILEREFSDRGKYVFRQISCEHQFSIRLCFDIVDSAPSLTITEW